MNSPVGLRAVDIKRLTETVQLNCNISDARHAGEYTLCVYLLKMRELYRWQAGLEWQENPDQGDVLKWITSRESEWEQLEKADYRPLRLGGELVDPFDEERANAVLNPLGYLYTAGHGRFGKALFMLARLVEVERTPRYCLRVAGEELARELAAPPAMAREGSIVVRDASLQRLVWELYEEWRWKRPDNAMGRLAAFYGFERDPAAALERATRDLRETLILHEIGEITAEEVLGREWNPMLQSILRTGAEAGARAVRDHLADCLTLLPALLQERDEPALHFYFANLTPLRRDLFPALVSAYEEWVSGGGSGALSRAVRAGREHWSRCGEEMVALHRRRGAEARAGIERLVERSVFK